jgi:hypothetical protein
MSNTAVDIMHCAKLSFPFSDSNITVGASYNYVILYEETTAEHFSTEILEITSEKFQIDISKHFLGDDPPV